MALSRVLNGHASGSAAGEAAADSTGLPNLYRRAATSCTVSTVDDPGRSAHATRCAELSRQVQRAAGPSGSSGSPLPRRVVRCAAG